VSDRNYEIEAENILPDGFVPGEPLEAPADDPGALADLMLKAAAVLEMVGGSFAVSALRKEIAPGLWVPDRYVAKWDSFAPGASIRRQQEAEQRRRQEAAELLEPEAELEPAAAPAAAAAVPEPELPAEPAPEDEPLPELEADLADEDELGPSPDPGVDPGRPVPNGADVMDELLGSGNGQADAVLAEVG